MEEKSVPQYATVEQPFGIELQPMFCPICGHHSINTEEDSDEYYKVTPCEHLAFIYLNDIDEYEYQSEDFAKRLENIPEDEDTDEDIEDEDIEDEDDEDTKYFYNLLVKAGYDNKMLAVEIVHGGMACGPVWNSVTFGYDYGKLSGK